MSVISATAQQSLVTGEVESVELPRGLVLGIARSVIHPDAGLPRDVSLALVNGSTAFLSQLVINANDVAIDKHHKAISAPDVLKALENMYLGDVGHAVQADFQAYKEEVARATKGRGRGSATSKRAKEQQQLDLQQQQHLYDIQQQQYVWHQQQQHQHMAAGQPGGMPMTLPPSNPNAVNGWGAPPDPQIPAIRYKRPLEPEADENWEQTKRARESESGNMLVDPAGLPSA